MPNEQRPRSAEARAAAVAAIVAGGAGGAAAGAAGASAAVGIVRALTRLFLSWGYSRQTVASTTRLVVRVTVWRRRIPRGGGPDPVGTPYGPAQAAADRAADVFAAWFLERASARLNTAEEADPDPVRDDDGMSPAERRESRWLDQHLEAQERRRKAAERVDAEAGKAGQRVVGGRVILRWRAYRDDRVTVECRAADGAWFYADRPPMIGFPGMPHGGTCRCAPVPAGTGALGPSVDDRTANLFTTDERPFPGDVDPDERRTA